MFNSKTGNKLLLEFLWWIFTAVLILILLFPLYKNNIDFPFYDYNVFFIIIAITFTRLIFQLKHTFVSFNIIIKFLLMFFSVVVIMLVFRGLSLYNIFIDERGPYYLFEHLPLSKRYTLSAFVKWEYFFFGITGFVASVILPFRLLISVFRVKNRGTE